MPFIFSAGLTPCFKERYDAFGLDRIPPPGRFIPKCTQLGEYKRLQCSGSTGYCWCVERNGKEIRGTRKRGSPPHCLKDGKSSITIIDLFDRLDICMVLLHKSNFSFSLLTL